MVLKQSRMFDANGSREIVRVSNSAATGATLHSET
jgi:hypothetical protein